MKAILLILALLTCAIRTQARGTFQFTVTLNGANETPPNNSRWSGVGTFSLNGDSLNYELDIPLPVNPTGGGIFDGNNILASEFGTPVIAAPGPSGQLGGLMYFGSVTPDAQRHPRPKVGEMVRECDQ